MRSGLLLPEKALGEYVDPAVMGPLMDVPAILVTSVDADLTTTEGEALWTAVMDAAAAAKAAHLPQLVALRDDYPDEYAEALNSSGAYVVYIRHDPTTPAHPYYALSQLVDRYCGQHTTMIMTIPGQNIVDSVTALVEAAQRFDVVVGSRDYETFMDLSRSRRLVEAIAAQAISDIAGVPFDTLAGILALTAKGRETLHNLGEPRLHFFTTLAYWARKWKIRTGGVELRYVPSAEVAALEDASPTFLAELCTAVLRLLEQVGKLCSTSGPRGFSERQRHAYNALMMGLDVLRSYAGTHT